MILSRNKEKIVAIVEARMTSSRLPGKVMMEALGKPMIQYLIERLKTVQYIDEIVIATTTNETDDVLQMFCESMEVRTFRGSENDVMARVVGAAESFNASVIVEITGDCPIVDPGIIETCIEKYYASGADYLSNARIRSYPVGMDVQVFGLKTLQKSLNMTNCRLDREHVTLHIKNNPQIFSHEDVIAPDALYWPELGLTLDEKDDYTLICKIIEHFTPEMPFFSCNDSVGFLKSRPDLVAINTAVERKGDS